MDNIDRELTNKLSEARTAAKNLAVIPSETKDDALRNLANALEKHSEVIKKANNEDIAKARSGNREEHFISRLTITKDTLHSMSSGVLNVASLPDPIGQTVGMQTLPNGLSAGRVRVPLGVIGVIYESRPNVTIDISALCIKSGNAVVLRGGTEATNSNQTLAKIAQQSFHEAGLPDNTVQIIESTDRSIVRDMLTAKGQIDLLVPRGGADLINLISEKARVPAITGGVGVCHTYVDASADMDMAVNIVHNAKTSNPSVCNALDTVIIHSSIAKPFLSQLSERWSLSNVKMKCDNRALNILGPIKYSNAERASDEDWDIEHLSLTIGVKIVDSLNEALAHIEHHGSGHSEAIISENYSSTRRFLSEVDASAVFINTSTRFNDGGQLGLGAEVAISTNKLHARGPMGLVELTSYKWTVLGTGQIRE